MCVKLLICRDPLPVAISNAVQESRILQEELDTVTISLTKPNFNYSNYTYSTAQLFVDNFSSTKSDVSVTEYFQK